MEPQVQIQLGTYASGGLASDNLSAVEKSEIGRDLPGGVEVISIQENLPPPRNPGAQFGIETVFVATLIAGITGPIAGFGQEFGKDMYLGLKRAFARLIRRRYDKQYRTLAIAYVVFQWHGSVVALQCRGVVGAEPEITFTDDDVEARLSDRLDEYRNRWPEIEEMLADSATPVRPVLVVMRRDDELIVRARSSLQDLGICSDIGTEHTSGRHHFL